MSDKKACKRIFMTKQERLVKELQSQYEERIQEIGTLEQGTIFVLASLYLKILEDLETYRTMWNKEMSRK